MDKKEFIENRKILAELGDATFAFILNNLIQSEVNKVLKSEKEKVDETHNYEDYEVHARIVEEREF